MYVQWRNDEDKHLGYFLMEDDGREIYQAHVKPEQWERARKKKTGIENIILEDAGQKIGREKQPRRSVQVVRVDASEHNHDDRYLMGMAEHEHPYAPSDHGHDMAHKHDEIAALDQVVSDNHMEVLKLNQATAQAVVKHDHVDKADVVHGHDDLRADINLLMTRMRAQEEHRHEDKADRNHGHPEIMQEIASLRVEVAALRELLTTHKHDLPEHSHELPKHEHDYATHADIEALKVSREKTLIVKSKQEVAGKTRFIVEEPE